MLRRLLFAAIIAVIIIAVLFSGRASAVISSQQKLRKSESVVRWYEGEGNWTLRPRFEKCWHLKWSKAEDRCYRHRQGYRFHRERVDRLTPDPPAIRYLAGWLCIHAREGAWNSQTGNGYYGGLQMTYGWMGLVQNAALLSPYQQMAAAETGYRASGYSSAWMAGQWPNTYPPCAGYF